MSDAAVAQMPRTLTLKPTRADLQAVFDVKPHLTARWLTAGYHLLTVLFLCFTLVYSYAAVR